MSTEGPYANLNLGKNDPCPCGSGRKYKRCHGMPPEALAPAGAPAGGPPGSMMGAGPMGGFDPNNMDPQMMMQMSQAIQRLPKGQLQRLQAIMQKAMAGKDVTRESQELERSLPREFQEMMRGFAASMPAMAGAGGEMGGLGGPGEMIPEAAGAAPGGMSEEEARALVAKAAAEGKISTDQAAELLGSGDSAAPSSDESGGKGISRLWRRKGK